MQKVLETYVMMHMDNAEDAARAYLEEIGDSSTLYNYGVVWWTSDTILVITEADYNTWILRVVEDF